MSAKEGGGREASQLQILEGKEGRIAIDGRANLDQRMMGGVYREWGGRAKNRVPSAKVPNQSQEPPVENESSGSREGGYCPGGKRKKKERNIARPKKIKRYQNSKQQLT